ncbi:GNAT family N-acetyltransferase [Methanolobus sp. WCC1]|uniref:GNAT family N-acetyltransferase n=1 Tax=unclassified Methanolobus TaxID=2629569 RepID=UPI0032513F72
MIVLPFSNEYSSMVKSFVIAVLAGEGFDYDPVKDFDLDDIQGIYLEKGGAFFMCLSDDEIVGTSAVKNVGSDVCEIKRLYVKKECRGEGLGFTLFQKALNYAEINYTKVKLKTDSSLKKAISIYLKNGFSVVKEESGTVYFEKSLQSDKSE